MAIAYLVWTFEEHSLTPRQKLIISLPIIAGAVIVFVALGLFTNPYVILVVFALWLVVTIRNRRKYGKPPEKAKGNK